MAVLQTYVDIAVANADYATSGSVAKAKAFIAAVEAMLLLAPQQTGHGAATLQLPVQTWADRLQAAQAWLAMAESGGARHFSLRSYRNG